jgi:hypothetical protein
MLPGPLRNAPALGVVLYELLTGRLAFQIDQKMLGAALLGRRREPRLGARTLVRVLIGAWLVFYSVFFALMPN